MTKQLSLRNYVLNRRANKWLIYGRGARIQYSSKSNALPPPFAFEMILGAKQTHTHTRTYARAQTVHLIPRDKTHGSITNGVYTKGGPRA